MGPRVVVLGPLPPPFGGVSLHIIRFLELLRAEGLRARGLPYTGTTRSGRWQKLRQAGGMILGIYVKSRPGRGDVLHVHYGGLGYFLALAPLLVVTGARKVITFHSVRVIQDLNGRGAWLRAPVLALLNRFDLFVAVRAEIGAELRRLGLARPAISVMPAFLPPAPAEQDLQRLPVDVAATLTAAQAAGRVQVCCGAYNLGPGYGHDDLYGIEELLAVLGARGPAPDRAYDLWVLVSNRPQLAEQRRAEAGILAAAGRLQNVRLHLHYGLPLIPVMARCSAFLRPSREDGDSVAIREALAMGLPVLASDVVERPAGVRTYRAAGPAALAGDLWGFLAGLAPMGAEQVHPILPGEVGRFRTFVREVVGYAAAR
ncbi:MAG: glycosyltransferase [Candidatus Krumholzibacteriia bacterium]